MASEEPTQTPPRVTRRRSTRPAATVDEPALIEAPDLGEQPNERAIGTEAAAGPQDAASDPIEAVDGSLEPAAQAAPPRRQPRKRATRPAAAPPPEPAQEPVQEPVQAPALDLVPETAAIPEATASTSADESSDDKPRDETSGQGSGSRVPAASFGVLFQPPTPPPARTSRRRVVRPATVPEAQTSGGDSQPDHDIRHVDDDSDRADHETANDTGTETASEPMSEPGTDSDTGRRPRRRGGKGRRRPADEESTDTARDTGDQSDGDNDDQHDDHQHDQHDESDHGEQHPGNAETSGDDDGASTGHKRTRRRRRSTNASEGQDPPGTVTKVREPRAERDEATAIRGSTRLEAKKLRRREGREAGRRRTVITEAEFLARRESVERVMVVRQRGERTQIGVLEDGVLVEHYVSTAGSGQGGANGAGTSVAGNVYLGRVQNVLPSMEAAFVDVGKGRNAVLYAGEVNWDAAGLESSRSRRIEQALSSGQGVLVQATKDPIGHKGARLTSQVSLPGRFLVYVPDGTMTGISRKLPETERNRLKHILREIVPDNAGVIVRTAAEGATEAELTADVERLTKIWESIQHKAKSASAPALLHGEVDLTVRVIRDVFNEDFGSLIVSGDQAWATISDYVDSVAPDLATRLTKWTGQADVFAQHRIDEQLAKAMDRKVWLPSGGSLVIDRTEAMTVVDVNTGKFVGSGGNLEETVTKNNIEAAEEIVRQLRLRDIGGMIVIDFIDMVLEANRDLVTRRLLECLGRDRTKHQVAEVTSLGLVQMTRKRVGAGLIEVFSQPCEHCNGRGLLVRDEPVERQTSAAGGGDSAGSGGGGGTNGEASTGARSSRGRRTRAGSGSSSGNAGSGDAGTTGSQGRGAGTSVASGSGQDGPSTRPAATATPAPGGPTPAQIAARAHAAARATPAHDGDEDPRLAGTGAESITADAPSLSGQEPESDPLEASASTGYPAPRVRRKRTRVVAPAGPPRTQSDGSSTEPVTGPAEESAPEAGPHLASGHGEDAGTDPAS